MGEYIAIAQTSEIQPNRAKLVVMSVGGRPPLDFDTTGHVVRAKTKTGWQPELPAGSV